MATASTVRAAVSTGEGRQAFEDLPFGRTAEVVATIPVTALRSATGLIPTATELAGSFNISVATNVHLAQAEITDNETEVSVAVAQLVLPADYKPGTDLTIRVPCAVVKTGAATDNGSTVDLSVYRQAAGAVGADLVSTAAQTFAAMDTWYNKDFVVAGGSLAPNDVLIVKLTSSIIDNEVGAGTLRFNCDALLVLGSLNT